MSLSSAHELGNGEVLLNGGTHLYVSDGWQDNPAAAEWSEVLEAAQYGSAGQARFHQGWGITTYNQYVYACEYGGKPGAFRAYLSSDFGKTFTEVFNLDQRLPGGATSNAHLHGGCLDPFHGAAPRLWQMTADSGNIARFYSDDLGGTWTMLSGNDFPTAVDDSSGIEPPNYVVVHATPSGLVIGSDDYPNGTAVIPRDHFYSTNPRIKTAHVFEDLDAREILLTHVAQAQVTIGDWVFTLFNPAGEVVTNGIAAAPPRITATHSGMRRGWTVWVGPSHLVSLRAIYQHNGELWVRNTNGLQTIRIPLFQTSQSHREGLVSDPGQVLGGKSGSHLQSLALHRTSSAVHLASTVLVPRATTTANRQLILAPFAEVDGTDVIAISNGVYEQQHEQNRVSIKGVASIGIGRRVTTDGLYNISLGDRCHSAGMAAIAVGAQADARSPGSSIAIGRNAHALEVESVALGRDTDAGNRSIAVGVGARATANSSIALGRNAEVSTNATEGVAIGRSASVGNRAIAVGSGAHAPGSNGSAIGRNSSAVGASSIAVGQNASCSGARGVALGVDADASQADEFALGAMHMKWPVFGGSQPNSSAGVVRLYPWDNNGQVEMRMRLPGDNSIYKLTMEAV